MIRSLFFITFALITFGTIGTGFTQQENMTGDVLQSIIKETITPKGKVPAEDKAWDREMRSNLDAENQKIDNGVKHGNISKREARDFKDELNKILDKLDRMKQEGQINQREKEAIESDIDRLDREVSGVDNVRGKRY